MIRETAREAPDRYGIQTGRLAIFGFRGRYARAVSRECFLAQAALARRLRTALLAAREGAFARRDR